MRLRVGLVAVVAFLLGSCGNPSGTVEIVQVQRVWERPDAVRVTFSGCDPRPRAEVDETESQVEITLRTARSTGCEPLHGAVFDLEQPLGDREVVDGSTGESLVVHSAS